MDHVFKNCPEFNPHEKIEGSGFKTITIVLNTVIKKIANNRQVYAIDRHRVRFGKLLQVRAAKQACLSVVADF